MSAAVFMVQNIVAGFLVRRLPFLFIFYQVNVEEVLFFFFFFPKMFLCIKLNVLHECRRSAERPVCDITCDQLSCLESRLNIVAAWLCTPI